LIDLKKEEAGYEDVGQIHPVRYNLNKNAA